MKLLFHMFKYRLSLLLRSLGWQVSKYHKLKEENNIYKIQKNLLAGTPIDTVFDVGAWIGNTTASFAEHFSQAKIYTFEPFPASYEKLEKRFASSDHNITLVKSAVSDEVGSATFHSNKIETTNSLLASQNNELSTDFYRDTVEEIKVETTTLDEFCQANTIERINILKFDTQGAELKGLQGAARLLTDQKIDLIYCEVNFVAGYSESPLYHHIAAYLEGFGYRLHNLYGLNVNERGELYWGDAIFISSVAHEKAMKT